jgi:hypothetical protein
VLQYDLMTRREYVWNTTPYECPPNRESYEVKKALRKKERKYLKEQAKREARSKVIRDKIEWEWLQKKAKEEGHDQLGQEPKLEVDSGPRSEPKLEPEAGPDPDPPVKLGYTEVDGVLVLD